MEHLRDKPEEPPLGTSAAKAARKATFPLGVKVACFIIGLVVLLVGGFGLVTARRSAALLEAEIDQRGTEIARVLAEGMPRATHTEFGRTWSIMFETPPVEDSTGEWTFRRQQERKAWLGTFQQLMQGGDLFNVVVVEGGKPTLFADPPEQFAFRPDSSSGDGSPRGGVGTRGSETVAVRLFRQPILSTDRSKTFGQVEIYMSLAAVDRARSKMMGSTALLGGGASILGVLLSILVGGMVSRPVRTLTRDMAVVRTGNFEHRTAVATADEIGMLAAAFNEMTAGLQESERMRNDLRLAQDIQAKLLPAKLPAVPGYELAARYRPATEVSGDYYDVFLLPDGRFGIAVGDVSGKGVAAGLVMTMTRALVRMGALGGLPPKKLLSRINSVLFQDLKRGAFVTLMYAIVDPQEGLIRFASAGHNPLVLWQPEGGYSEVEGPGIALGVAKPAVFDARTEEVTATLPPGGRFLIYTDGVTEAMSKEHEQYGEERLKKVTEAAGTETCERFLRRLLDDIDAHRKDAPPWDDITMVAVRRLVEVAPKPAATVPPEGHSEQPARERAEDETSFLTDTSRRIAAMRGDLLIKIENKPDGCGIVRILGSVDAHTFPDLEHAFKKLESIGVTWVVVDLSAMTYISSIGLNFIVNRRVHLVQNDGDVTLVNPQPAIAKIFKMLGLYDVLRVTATEDEALAARGTPPRVRG